MNVGQSLSDSLLDDASLAPSGRPHDEARFDITAMIDLVFMMNIFFLVTTVAAALTEVDLPTAKHCAPADPETSVTFTVLAGNGREPALVYVGDSTAGRPVPEGDQPRVVREAVEKGVRERKNTILIKAEKSVRVRDVARIAAAGVQVPGTELKLAVVEME